MDVENIDELYEVILNDPNNLKKIAVLSSGFNLFEIIKKFEKGELGKGYLHNLEKLRKASVIAARLHGTRYLRDIAIPMVNAPQDYKLDANPNQVARHWIMNLRALYKQTLSGLQLKEPELLLECIAVFYSYQEPIKGYAKKALRRIGTPDALSFLEKIE